MNIVTGAFGYIGQYITRLLLERGEQVATITTHLHDPNPFGPAVQAFPYNFDHPDRLVETLRGARALYNTYWVRFEHGGLTFAKALENSAILFECARRAGIERIIHISVTNASPASPLPYYRGKALQEEALKLSGVSYAILRPTLVFGIEDILVNNVAWLMRKFPIFPIFGNGSYRLQPVFVGDLVAIALNASLQTENLTLDAAGPEIFTWAEFVGLMAQKIKPGLHLTPVSPWPGITAGKIVGRLVGDVILTRDELRGLMDEMLLSHQPPLGSTRFSEWMGKEHDRIGVAYTSELARHFR